jgi:DNA polymerase
MNETPSLPSPRALLQRLESLQAAGVTQLPRRVGRILEAAEQVVDAVPAAPARVPPTTGRSLRGEGVAGSPALLKAAPVPPSLAAGPSSAPSLEILRSEVAGCTACGELAQTRTQTVFGVGNPNARLCFMGEAPGADEDRLGEPFVGRAGQLLDKMIEACTLSRGEVYILNVLKCRPPGNRNPTPAEAGNCRGFLRRQLELINPEYVCCLGAVAAQNFLQTDTPIGRLRGRVHEHDGRKVVCTYHPAYLLRNPSAKKHAWDDLKLLMRELGVEL